MAEPSRPSSPPAPSSGAARATSEHDPGAPIAPDHIDPDLVKLPRTRLKVGLVTAAGLIVLSVVYLIRLAPDLRFARASTAPIQVAAGDIVAGKVATDQLVAVAAEPVVAHAIRVATTPGRLGLRVAPARGTADQLWIVVPGSGGMRPAFESSSAAGYVGRLRRLEDLAFATVAQRYAAEQPRLAFATPAAIRAGLATGKVATVAGDQVSLDDSVAVALDVVAPDAAIIVASFNERLPDTAAWTQALIRAGLPPAQPGAPAAVDAAIGQVRLAVAVSSSEATTKLEAAGLWAARIEPVTRHVKTTWATMRKSPPAGLDVGGQLLPDAQIELVGLAITRPIPAGAYAVVTGEVPDDYWYVVPIMIALTAISLVFLWALIRAIRRDILGAA